MPTLVTTSGASNANAYVSLADANTYNSDERLHNSEWTSASTSDREASIIWATKLLDQVDWSGWKTDSSQALRYPRAYVWDLDGYPFDSTVIPNWLEDATADLAYHLVVTDRTADPDTKGLAALNAGSVKVDVDKFDALSQLPRSVKLIIKPYRQNATSLRMQRA
jgi:hypothetical protein